MYKILGLVAVAASLSFGEIITTTIDLPVSRDGWDHYQAALIGVNLANYIGTNEKITGASLILTGIQNLKEKQDDDKLWVSLLQYNKDISGNVDISYKQDNEEVGNYFSDPDIITTDYTFNSKLLEYTDNNDVGATSQNYSKVAYWDKTRGYLNELETCLNGPNPYAWRYVGNGSYGGTENVQYVKNGIDVNSIWENGKEYKSGQQAKTQLWSKYSGWTTEDRTIALSLDAIKDIMENGNVGFGIDADCHYTGKIQLVVTKEKNNVPEPSLLTLLGCGLLGLVFVRRRK